VLILDGHERGIDDDRLLAAGTPVDFGVPSNEFTLRRTQNRLSQGRVNLLGDLPPEGCPERLAFNVGEFDSDGIERDVIDFEHRAVYVQKANKLNHGVQRDARKLLAILFPSVAG
jgi:hypothetical protein